MSLPPQPYDRASSFGISSQLKQNPSQGRVDDKYVEEIYMADIVSPLQPEQETPKRRPPEIDAYIDQFLSTMCETSRRQILELLAQPKNDGNGSALERRSTDIARELGLSPSTTSEHLKQLTRAGLVVPRREGTTVYYCIRNILLVQVFHDLIKALDEHYNPHALEPDQQVT
jgi:DNA-binding transcriptional ArsR family regulator